MSEYLKVKLGKGKLYHIVAPNQHSKTLCKRYVHGGNKPSPLAVAGHVPLFKVMDGTATHPGDICAQCLASWEKLEGIDE